MGNVLLGGREIRRVPLEFKWPISKIWPGFIYYEDESWQKVDPPIGDGFQVWETVSEGSPISPVFASVDPLLEWMSANESPPGFSRKERVWTPEEWGTALNSEVFLVDGSTGELISDDD